MGMGTGIGMGMELGWDGDWDGMGTGTVTARCQAAPPASITGARPGARCLTEDGEHAGAGGAGEEGPVGPQGQLGVAGDVLAVVPGAGGQQVTDGHADAPLDRAEPRRPQRFRPAP